MQKGKSLCRSLYWKANGMPHAQKGEICMYVSKIFRNVMLLCLIVFFVPAATAADLSSFFSSPEFGFPPLLQDVKFGMTADELTQAVPAFKGDRFSYKVDGYEGISLAKDMSYGSLYSISITFAPEFTDVASFLQEKWGNAITEEELDGSTSYHWFDRDKGMRAKLKKQWDDMLLTYYQYIPFEKLFPENVPTLPTPLKGMQVGMPLAKVSETIPEFQSSRWVDLKGYFDVRIWYLARQDSTIKYFTVSFPEFENVREVLVKKWGEPQKDENGKEYWKNEELEYIDKEGNTKKGIFAIYRAETLGNDGIDFTPDLYDYEYE